MNSRQKAAYLAENRQTILDSFCPDCGGCLVDENEVDRWRKTPILCLDCDRRMGYADPVAWPGTTITALDWSRAAFQIQNERTTYLLADVVDQVVGRLTAETIDAQ